MRQPARVVRIARAVRYVVILLALCVAARAHADDRTEARAHYQAGVKLYTSGDYQGAIREFSAAQQLVPADLNNYNLALCYDKLGDAEPAVQYYRAFLDRQPNTDKRAEVEASIHRLEAAARSAASKKADEARRAPRPDELPAPSGSASAPVAPPAPGPSSGPAPGPAIAPDAPSAPSAAASGRDAPPAAPDGPAPRDEHRRRTGPATAAPGSGSPAPTGDPQLDRANAINIDEIRDRSAAGGGPADHRTGPAVAASDPSQPSPSSPSGSPAPAPNSQPGNPDEPKKETPVYKKWWFWAVVAVSGYVVYELATTSSNSTSSPGRAATAPGGLTLLRW